MANWKLLEDIKEVENINILLRESYPVVKNVSFYAGILQKCSEDKFAILTANGKVEIYPDDYTYHYIRIDEILF